MTKQTNPQTADLDAHSERQFVLTGLIMCALIVRLLLAAFQIIPWSGWLWLAIAMIPATLLAWLIKIGME